MRKNMRLEEGKKDQIVRRSCHCKGSRLDGGVVSRLGIPTDILRRSGQDHLDLVLSMQLCRDIVRTFRYAKEAVQ